MHNIGVVVDRIDVSDDKVGDKADDENGDGPAAEGEMGCLTLSVSGHMNVISKSHNLSTPNLSNSLKFPLNSQVSLNSLFRKKEGCR